VVGLFGGGGVEEAAEMRRVLRVRRLLVLVVDGLARASFGEEILGGSGSCGGGMGSLKALLAAGGGG